MLQDKILQPHNLRNVAGQNITASQLTRSKIPFPLGRSLYLDHKFSSNLLINVMHRFGICESQKKTADYKYANTDPTNNCQEASMATRERD